jgi:hypothetical protein
VCVIWQEKRAHLDTRSLALAGDSTWLRSGIRVFSRRDKMTAHQWIQLIRSAGSYILADIMIPEQPPMHHDHQDALDALLNACQQCLTEVSPAGIADEGYWRTVQLFATVVEALAQCDLVSANCFASVTPTDAYAHIIYVCYYRSCR